MKKLIITKKDRTIYSVALAISLTLIALSLVFLLPAKIPPGLKISATFPAKTIFDNQEFTLSFAVEGGEFLVQEGYLTFGGAKYYKPLEIENVDSSEDGGAGYFKSIVFAGPGSYGYYIGVYDLAGTLYIATGVFDVFEGNQ